MTLVVYVSTYLLEFSQVIKLLCLKSIKSKLYCAVVSLKPGHMDWVRDFGFILNLFSFPPPPNQPTTCSSDGSLTDHSGRTLGTVH